MSRATDPVPSLRSARRRHLAILFADLSESTRLAGAMEAEQYADLLGELRAAYEAIIPKHGGTIVRVQGDGLLAIFGVPETLEDDGRRAAEAALDLHERVRGLRLEAPPPGEPALSLHTGIHSGLVLVDEGDLVRGRFELLGDAPNIAARLSDLAQAGEILVSEETLGAESQFFQTGERRLLSLKGRAEPVAARAILARAPVSTRFEARARRGLVRFVGRERELQALERALDETLAGAPRFLAIAAPAGMGKTRLAEEFLQRAAAREFRILRGYCESYLSAEPLQPFLQILRSLCGLTTGLPGSNAAEALDRLLSEVDPGLHSHRAELLRALSPGADASAGGGAKRPTAADRIAALRDLVDRLAAAQPVVLFIDDWQWADDATRQVLAAIRNLEQRPILVLVATRGFAAGDADTTDARVLELAPFTADEAAATIDRLTPRIDPFLATEIRCYAGGNPLYIEELCHSAAHAGADDRLGRLHGGAAWLDTLINSRVARLPLVQAEIVRAAAVIGNVIPSWLLESVTGYGQDEPLVRELAEQDFIFPGEAAGTLRFKHGITRDAIYASVGLRERRAMHLRIAESLRGRGSVVVEEGVYEALAYHYGAGGQWAEASRYAELAGDKAIAASALDRAQTQYRAALAALDAVEASEDGYRRWNSIAQRLGLACVFDPSRDQLEVFRRAVTLASARDDHAANALAEYWLGYINYALGEPRTAIHHCERGLALARQVGDDPLAIQIVATLGQAHSAACDYRPARVLLDEAIAVKRRHRTGARPAVGLAYTLACKGAVLGDQGSFAEAHAHFEEGLDAVRGASHEVEASILELQSAVYLWQGRWGDAMRSAGRALSIAERVRSRYIFAMASALTSYAEWKTNASADALRSLADATSWVQSRGREHFISLNYGWLAEGAAASGAPADARRHAARAVRRARKGDRLGEAMAYRAAARAAAGDGDCVAAERLLERAMDAARERGSRHEIAVTQLCHAEIALGQGDRALAAARLDEATSGFASMDMAWHLEQAARLRSLL